MADLREKLIEIMDTGFYGANAPDIADQIIAALPELLVTPERVERALGAVEDDFICRRGTGHRAMTAALTAALTEPGDR